MRRFLIIALSLGAALVVACGGDSEPESLPTDEATPNVQATVQALVRATVESLPTPTPTLVTPTNTPVPTSTPPPPRPTATRISASTSTPTPGPTGTPFVAIITPTLVPIPPPTSTPRPTATPSPIPTPTATPVPPSPTPTPTIFDILDDSTPAVVRITAGDKQGSGFIIKSDGVIITANHLVSVVSTAEVELADGRKLNGNVVGRHIAADLAVLQISAQDLPTIPLGDSDELMPGDLIFKVGYTTESSSSDAIVKAGIITAFTVHQRSLNQVVQTDEPLKAGDSGGPLLNRQGEVIGVSSANIVVFEEEGAGYASTINQLSSNLNQLLAGRPVCPLTPTVFDGPTFRHNSLRYDVILPKGSNFGSDQQSEFVFLGRDTPRVGVTIHNPTSKKFFDDIESFFDSTLEDVKGRNNVESVEILDFRPVCLISIGDAIEVDVKVRAGSQNFLHRWLLFFTGSDAYFLEGSAPVSSWPVSEKWIDSLMYSFTF